MASYGESVRYMNLNEGNHESIQHTYDKHDRTRHDLDGGIDSPEELHHAVDFLKGTGQYECHDYDPPDADINEQAIQNRSVKEYGIIDLWKWVVSALIGFSMGVVGFLTNAIIDTLLEGRLGATETLIKQGRNFASYLVNILLVVGFVSLPAFGVSFIEPWAAGSGISELKAYLNGIHLKGLMRIKTLLPKIGGIAFVISSGLFAGKEGPFVVGGGILGGGISSFGSQSLGFQIPGKPFSYLRNPVDKRDFVAIGTAAGVACAISAPIGGMLFMVEEGCSFFSTILLWRSFLATSIAVYTMNLLHQLFWEPSDFLSSKYGIRRDFGLYTDDQADFSRQLWWYAWEVPIFALIGVLSGLIGALFVHLNMRLMRFRAKFIPKSAPVKRALEAIVIAVGTSTIGFLVTRLSSCRDVPQFFDSSRDFPDPNLKYGAMTKGQLSNEMFKSWFCNKEGTFSEYGQLFLSPIGRSLQLMLDLGVVTMKSGMFNFSAGVLVAYMIYSFLMVTWTYGSGIPTGLFVPSMSIGAALGVLVGKLVSVIVQAAGWSSVSINLHSYGIIGAGATLGGATRLTISLTVLTMETTGGLELIIPMMITIFCATYTGNLFNLGIYDAHNVNNKLPFLEEDEPTKHGYAAADKLRVGQVMADDLVSVPPVAKVREVVDTLSRYSHSAFPISQQTQNGQPATEFELEGSITRPALLKVIEHRVNFFSGGAPQHGAGAEPPTKNFNPQKQSAAASEAIAETLSNVPMKAKEIEEQSVSEEEMEMQVDLRPLMQRHPFIVHSNARLSRAYRLFRTMGLRHLYVTPKSPRVVGMITRKDISEENARLTLSEAARDAYGSEDEHATRSGFGGVGEGASRV